MKAVWSWLLELVDLDRVPTVEEGARALTAGGLEIEGITDLGAGFSGVVVAEVVAKRPHPHAEKLTLVDVVTERDGIPTQVVCGAANVPAPGKRVLWARPGATLPGGLTLGVKPVKGIESPGMLCSEPELGIGEDASGIIVLDESEAPALGAPAQHPLGLADWVLEVNVPANRGDCLGHLGIARELAALVGGRLRPPAPVLDDLRADLDIEDVAEVHVDDHKGCARYVARVIEGVTVRPSPRRLQQRLRAIGVRPISNLVDVTNYVMFELGQPLHAFDWEKLVGARIVVRRARNGEKMTTLDGIERALEPEDVLICDAERPVALGGVMGGHDSEVSPTTHRVLLEAASFDARAIRRTARRLGLHSEASHRFERGVDPALCELASARATELLARLGGGRVADGAIDEDGLITDHRIGARERKPVRVSLRVPRARALTGVPLDIVTCKTVLERLGMTVAAGVEADALSVDVPTSRPDVTREADLIEEVMRVVGYDTVPATLPALRAAPLRTADPRPDRARRALAATGLSEAITFGFQSVERLSALRLPDGDRRAAPIALRNPMSVDQAIMRTSLVPNLLAAIARNISFGRRDVAIFEVGSVFLRAEGEARDGEITQLGDEPVHAVAVLTGARPAGLGSGTAWDVFDAKGVAEALLAELVEDPSRVRVVADPTIPYLHPGVAARLELDGATIGELGEVHPDTRAALGVEQPVFVVDVDLTTLGGHPVRQMRAIPRFPATSRDVSLLLAESISAQRVRDVIDAASSPLVENVRVLEDYRGDRLPAGHKSMLWSITYRAADRTLTDAEVEAAHEAIVAKLLAELPAQRR
jgi:phenylalanyl-tRNA synthetase beta chain